MIDPRLLRMLVVVLVAGGTSAASAQSPSIAPPYVYCPESTHTRALATLGASSLTLTNGIAQVAKEWAMDRGVVLLQFATWLNPDAPDTQRLMRQTLEAVIAALVAAGIPRAMIYERPERLGPEAATVAIVFALLPNRGAVCRQDRQRWKGY
jgi:hypothetical protein